ncbi:MAG: hypothetical protein J4G09_13585 [Proteobacteria bacterium]|nr:hypothetical protein [Pseudomonadota bacterium]
MPSSNARYLSADLTGEGIYRLSGRLGNAPHFTSSLNGHQAVSGSDGVYRLVIAHSDPDIPNWLATAGHREGIIFYRYHLAKTRPVPTARRVALEDLESLLPADSPRVTPDECQAEIDRRRASVIRRWSP